MLINQANNNGGQVLELEKIFKDVHFNPKTNMWIHHEDETIYICVSFHPYHVCKPITYVVLMLWLLVSFSLSNDRKLFSKCKRIIVKILMQFPLHKGLGMRPSSSLVTNALSSSSVEYIHRLESEILSSKRQKLGTKRSELGNKRRNKRRELSKKRSKRIFLTFWGARVMMMLLGVVHLQVKTLID